MTASRRRIVVALGVITLVAVSVALLLARRGDPTGRATGVGALAPSAELGLVGYPAPGASEVPASWDGLEVPKPPPPPEGYPSGPVITLQAESEVLEIDRAAITPDGTDEGEPGGEPLPATLLTHPVDPALEPSAAALIPHAPLAPLRTYLVTFAGRRGSEPFEVSWTFTTRATSCDPLAQDCGVGQGCYVVHGEAECRWAGLLGLDERCRFIDACAPGLACRGSRCRPYCDASEASDPEQDCATHCPFGVAGLPKYDDANGVRVCLARPCVEEGATCGEDEGCYLTGWGFMCDWAGDTPAGGTCESAGDCAVGTSCVGLEAGFVCKQLCDGAGLPACEAACPEASQALPGEHGVGFCL